MNVEPGTLVVLYYGFFLFIFIAINKAGDYPQTVKLLLATPAILFVTLFPYWLEASLFLKFLLTVIGFFTSFNIFDLMYLDPVQQISFKEYMFYLSTSSRAATATSQQVIASSSFNINFKALWRLGKAVVKFIIFSTIFESVQKWDFSNSSNLEYYSFMYLMGGCLYLCFNVILDTVGLFWEFAFSMKPKELFKTPFMASSPRDFWSRRWNMFFRDFFHKIFFKDIKSLSYLRAILSSLTIFAISGVLHEYVYWSIMGKISGLNFMFFMLHGIATTFQVVIQACFPVLRRIPLFIAIPINTVFLALTIPLFVSPYIQSGFIRNVKVPFSLMPTLSSAVTEIKNLYL